VSNTFGVGGVTQGACSFQTNNWLSFVPCSKSCFLSGKAPYDRFQTFLRKNDSFVVIFLLSLSNFLSLLTSLVQRFFLFLLGPMFFFFFRS